MEYIVVNNWERHQHYKNRNPPWVKLETDIIEKYDKTGHPKKFYLLPDNAKLTLVCLLCLRANFTEVVPYEGNKALADRLGIKVVNLQPLIDAGYIEIITDASKDASTPASNVATPLDPKNSSEGEGENREREQRTEGEDVRNGEPFLTIPTKGEVKEYIVTEKKIEQWEELFPGLDIRQTVRDCKAWNIGNPGKRKTQSGIESHIVKWITKANNEGKNRRPLNGNNQLVFDPYVCKICHKKKSAMGRGGVCMDCQDSDTALLGEVLKMKGVQ